MVKKEEWQPVSLIVLKINTMVVVGGMRLETKWQEKMEILICAFKWDAEIRWKSCSSIFSFSLPQTHLAFIQQLLMR